MFTLDQLKSLACDLRLQPLVGKTVIVGLWQYFEEELSSQSQEFGKIVGFDEFLQLQSEDGEIYNYPVRYEALVPAPRGKYTLKTTGQEIANPDFLLSWRVDLVDPIAESTWWANTAPHVYSIVEEEWDFEEIHDQDYNNFLAKTKGQELIGKTILIGIRHYKLENGKRKFEGQTQEFGVITQVSASAGLSIGKRDDSIFRLPPDFEMIQRAPEGEYVLESTGEVIINPDYITKWTITMP